MNNWLHYSGPNSLPEGAFRWKIGLLSFVGRNRVRGAGYSRVTSPEFDDWDGYSVTTPKSLMYRELSETERAIVLGIHSYRCIEVEGYEDIAPCPFCAKVPTLSFKGLWIGAGPMSAEWWCLKCCGMINSYGFTHQRVTVLITFWNEKVKRVNV